MNHIADYTVLAALPPDSEEQQAKITAIQDEDSYNWGYTSHNFSSWIHKFQVVS